MAGNFIAKGATKEEQKDEEEEGKTRFARRRRMLSWKAWVSNACGELLSGLHARAEGKPFSFAANVFSHKPCEHRLRLTNPVRKNAKFKSIRKNWRPNEIMASKLLESTLVTWLLIWICMELPLETSKLTQRSTLSVIYMQSSCNFDKAKNVIERQIRRGEAETKNYSGGWGVQA